jgi:hypothetical protein
MNNSPSKADDPFKTPLEYHSWRNIIETMSGAMINTGANHNSKRSNSFRMFSFVFCVLFSMDVPITFFLYWKDEWWG